MKMITDRFFLTLIAGLFLCACGKNEDGDKTIPEIRIQDLSVPEGNTQNSVALIISLNAPAALEVSLTVNTEDLSAYSGKDYVPLRNQTLTINPGEISKSISIQILGNEFKEADKVFTVRISNARNGFIVKANAQVTIRNDDTKIFIPSSGFEAPANYEGMTLAWSDEFEGNNLNPAYWSHDQGDGCPQLCGWGNNELQFYTNSRDNLYFQDGHMIIEARKETYSGKDYTSSRIKTAGKKSFKFGRIDIRAVLPTGKGIWPAFWMLPEPNALGGWPRSGEIDIMEMVGHQPKLTHGTVHFGPGPGSTAISRSQPVDAGLQDAFHIFSLEWEEDRLRWYVDGQLFSTVTKADMGSATYPFNEEFYLLVNLAVGGNWPGAPDASTQFPQRYIVDYIRVYQK